jgi:hypothetical protein
MLRPGKGLASGGSTGYHSPIALHVIPGRRVAECCGRAATRFLFDECVRVLNAALASHSVELDRAGVERCTESVKRSLASCAWVTTSQPLAPRACQGLVRGRVGQGAACRSSLECVPPLHCQDASTARPGRCVPPARLGAKCAPGLEPLAAYLLERDARRLRPPCTDFCSPVSGRCEGVPPEGAECRASVNCAPGQRCVSGKCARSAPVSRAAPGDRCSTDLDCEAGGCVEVAGDREGERERRCGMKCSASLDALGLPRRAPQRPR